MNEAFALGSKLVKNLLLGYAIQGREAVERRKGLAKVRSDVMVKELRREAHVPAAVAQVGDAFGEGDDSGDVEFLDVISDSVQEVRGALARDLVQAVQDEHQLGMTTVESLEPGIQGRATAKLPAPLAWLSGNTSRALR